MHDLVPERAFVRYVPIPNPHDSRGRGGFQALLGLPQLVFGLLALGDIAGYRIIRSSPPGTERHSSQR
jgi:hypothetical protein